MFCGTDGKPVSKLLYEYERGGVTYKVVQMCDDPTFHDYRTDPGSLVLTRRSYAQMGLELVRVAKLECVELEIEDSTRSNFRQGAECK